MQPGPRGPEGSGMDQPQQYSPDNRVSNSFAEITRALDSLSQRLEQLERPGLSHASAGPETAAEARGQNVGEPLGEGRQRALAHFQEIASIPSTSLDANELFGLAMDRITRLLMVDRTVLFLLDPDQGRLYPRTSRGFRQDDLTEFSLVPGEGLVGRAFREGRPLVHSTPVGDTPADPFVVRFPVRDAIALPIRAEGEVAGVLYAGRRGRPAPFTVDEVQLLLFIADRVGAALGLRALLLVPLRARNGVIGCLYLGDRGVKAFSADEVEAARLLAALAAIAVENSQLYDELRRAHKELETTLDQLVQSEKARALGEMSAGIAHEFNNVLAIIVGKAQLMQERTEDPSFREDLGVIEEAAWRAADTVRRLQRFALTRMDEKPALVDLNRLIDDAEV